MIKVKLKILVIIFVFISYHSSCLASDFWQTQLQKGEKIKEDAYKTDLVRKKRMRCKALLHRLKQAMASLTSDGFTNEVGRLYELKDRIRKKVVKDSGCGRVFYGLDSFYSRKAKCDMFKEMYAVSSFDCLTCSGKFNFQGIDVIMSNGEIIRLDFFTQGVRYILDQQHLIVQVGDYVIISDFKGNILKIHGPLMTSREFLQEGQKVQVRLDVVYVNKIWHELRQYSVTLSEFLKILIENPRWLLPKNRSELLSRVKKIRCGEVKKYLQTIENNEECAQLSRDLVELYYLKYKQICSQ